MTPTDVTPRAPFIAFGPEALVYLAPPLVTARCVARRTYRALRSGGQSRPLARHWLSILLTTTADVR